MKPNTTLPTNLPKTLLVTAAAVLFAASAYAAPPTPVSSCGNVITTPGKYFLSTDLSCSGGTAVMIAASKVDLDLRGHRIDGENDLKGIGISTSSADISSSGDQSLCLGVTNIGIHDGTVTGYSVPGAIGILLCSPNDIGGPAVAMSVTVQRMVLTGNNTGLDLVSTAQNKITNNYVSNGDIGIDLSNGCSNNLISNNLLDGNRDQFGGGAGILIKGPSNTVTGNVAINNQFGIFISQVAVNTQTTNNYTSHNVVGIEAQEFAAGNVFNGNTSFANTSFDLEDDNGSCTSNTWRGNFFGTSSLGCIQ
jgi:parallel beta-helix repeat protein